VSTLAGALWEEFTTIHGKPRVDGEASGPDAALRSYFAEALRQKQAALCLSGGGIRSAAFSLGVLQALARHNLLSRFHYLSTVSGGGYIGGWLGAMLRSRNGDVAAVENALSATQAPPELAALRNYTNFLTPNPGIASRDTWAGVVLWVRNCVVNWLIFVPALFAMVLAPIVYAGLIRDIGIELSWLLLLIALACLGAGIFNGARHLPSHASSERGTRAERDTFVPLYVVGPLLVWSTLVPLVAAPWLRHVMPLGALVGDLIPWMGFVVMEAAYVVAALSVQGKHRKAFWRNLGWWTLASLVATLILWGALYFGIGLNADIIAVLGPLAVTVAHLFQSLIYVALRKEVFRGELDREWLARINAEKVVPALLWAVFAAVCLLLSPWLFNNWSTVVYPFLVSLAAGPVSALLGKYAPVAPPPPGARGRIPAVAMRVAADLAAAVFAVALFIVLARAGAVLSEGNWLGALVLMALAGLLAWWLGKQVSVNRFSMHAVYRNRLVRAFLGSARQERSPDPFTGFDPKDNPRMAELGSWDGRPRMLFPVINVTLNQTTGGPNAWSERKGQSFTISPCACGAAFLHRREDASAGFAARGAYVRTEAYAGTEKETGPNDKGKGVTLGTAIALSGAAASPSMGYHSSPATAFLMTLFNVRLGAWLPNPATASTTELARARPPNALVTLARELMGLSSVQGGAIYLSDGGHFENLGLYEMVRRRCRYIVVVDAGADPDAGFADLGNAVLKIRVDLDVEISFEPPIAITSRSNPTKPIHWFACGAIRYPEGENGELLYVKPADLPDVPMDVRAYRNAHDTFPHQPTIDQFFSESQFESYRELGWSEMHDLAKDTDSFDALFKRARDKLSRTLNSDAAAK
jgi:hypothetical protein